MINEIQSLNQKIWEIGVKSSSEWHRYLDFVRSKWVKIGHFFKVHSKYGMITFVYREGFLSLKDLSMVSHGPNPKIPDLEKKLKGTDF